MFSNLMGGMKSYTVCVEADRRGCRLTVENLFFSAKLKMYFPVIANFSALPTKTLWE